MPVSEAYKNWRRRKKNVIFGGRFGNYQYYDMDKVIEAALALVKKNYNSGQRNALHIQCGAFFML